MATLSDNLSFPDNNKQSGKKKHNVRDASFPDLLLKKWKASMEESWIVPFQWAKTPALEAHPILGPIVRQVPNVQGLFQEHWIRFSDCWLSDRDLQVLTEAVVDRRQFWRKRQFVLWAKRPQMHNAAKENLDLFKSIAQTLEADSVPLENLPYFEATSFCQKHPQTTATTVPSPDFFLAQQVTRGAHDGRILQNKMRLAVSMRPSTESISSLYASRWAAYEAVICWSVNVMLRVLVAAYATSAPLEHIHYQPLHEHFETFLLKLQREVCIMSTLGKANNTPTWSAIMRAMRKRPDPGTQEAFFFHLLTEVERSIVLATQLPKQHVERTNMLFNDMLPFFDHDVLGRSTSLIEDIRQRYRTTPDWMNDRLVPSEQPHLALTAMQMYYYAMQQTNNCSHPLSKIRLKQEWTKFSEDHINPATIAANSAEASGSKRANCTHTPWRLRSEEALTNYLDQCEAPKELQFLYDVLFDLRLFSSTIVPSRDLGTYNFQPATNKRKRESGSSPPPHKKPYIESVEPIESPPTLGDISSDHSSAPPKTFTFPLVEMGEMLDTSELDFEDDSADFS